MNGRKVVVNGHGGVDGGQTPLPGGGGSDPRDVGIKKAHRSGLSCLEAFLCVILVAGVKK